jgi:hypothetical protein
LFFLEDGLLFLAAVFMLFQDRSAKRDLQ